MTHVTLNNGVEMPALGLGVFQTPPEETRAAVEAALATGTSAPPPRTATSARLLEQATVVPAVNQIEVHPYFQQRAVQDFGADHGILTQAWSPIGGITFYRDSGHTSTLQDPVIAEIAAAHGRTPAQVMLRWHLQQGRSAIPKSTKPARIADQLAAIDALDTGTRGGPDPADITLATFSRDIPEA